MGFVSGLLGAAGGAAGTGFSAPHGANVLNPTTVDQANTAYAGNQTALTNQQNFLNAVQAQNGLGNQSQVYNQLQGVANGTGPNPAMAALNQATGANVANQASLMAGQRGANANVGLMSRQAAEQGAQTQQQSVGQGATMQANQSLNAISAAGQMANNQAAQQAAATSANTNAQQGEQSQLLNSIAQQNNANVGMQSNINSGNAALAGQTMGMQGQLMGNVMGGIGSALALAQGGQIPMMASGGSYGDASTDNFDTASAPLTAAPTSMAAASQPSISSPAPTPAASKGPKSVAGQHLNWNLGSNSGQSGPQGMGMAGNVIGSAIGKGLKSLFGSSNQDTPGAAQAFAAFDATKTPTVTSQDVATPSGGYTDTAGRQDVTDQTNFAKGGKAHKQVPAMVSAGEVRIHAKDVKKVAEGKKSPLSGEKIKGPLKVGGAKNSYANDIIPKTLNEGDIILPRSVTQSKHPHWAAHKFVSDIMAQKHRKGK